MALACSAPSGFLSPQGKPVALSPMLTLAGSQATTGPNTPMFSMLPDPINAKSLSKRFSRTVSGASTQIPDHDLEQGFFLDHDDSSPKLGHAWHECGFVADTQQLETLQSELGLWAQCMVHAEEFFAKEWRRKHGSLPSTDASSRLDPLQSELGLWAQAIISAGEWEYELAKAQQMQDGLAFTMDGKVVDLDGGAAVFSTLSCPALTLDGRTVDLEGGGAAFLLHDRSRAQGNQAKATLKENGRMFRAISFSHAACEAEALIEDEKVCAIDTSGVLHGLLLSSMSAEPSVSTRLKLFHKRKKSRKPSSWAGSSVVLCVQHDGKVVIALRLGHTPESLDRIRCKRSSLLARPQWESESSRLAMAVDAHGAIFL